MKEEKRKNGEEEKGPSFEFISDFNLPEYVKKYTTQKITDVLNFLPGNLKDYSKVVIRFVKEKFLKKAEVNVSFSKRFPTIKTEERGTDIKNIINKIAYEIERQIKKLKTYYRKEKKRSKKREITIETERDIEKRDEDIVIRTITIEKPMEIEDAKIRLEKSKEPFFVFEDEDGNINILYKKDGKYLLSVLKR